MASVIVGLAFLASGTVCADETSPATTSNLDKQIEQVADLEESKAEPVKEEGRVETEKKKHLLPIPAVLICSPEEIQDRAYPDTPVKELDTTTIVDKKASPKVETKSILKDKEETPKEAENENRAIIKVEKTSNISTTRGNPQLLPLWFTALTMQESNATSFQDLVSLLHLI